MTIGKAKRLLRASKSTAAEEILHIKKPPGQVDRDYNLREGMAGDGRLEISTDDYRKLLVSVPQTQYPSYSFSLPL